MHRVCLLTDYEIPLLPSSMVHPEMDISQTTNLTFNPSPDESATDYDPNALNDAKSYLKRVQASFPSLIVFALIAKLTETNLGLLLKAQELLEVVVDKKRFRLFLAPRTPFTKTELDLLQPSIKQNYCIALKDSPAPPPLPSGKSQMFFSAHLFDYIRRECENAEPCHQISYHEIVCPSCILRDMQEKQAAGEALKQVELSNLAKAEKRRAKQQARRLRQKEQRKARKAMLSDA